MFSFNIAELNGWGWVYLALTGIGIFVGLYRLAVGKKAVEPIRGGAAALLPLVYAIALSIPFVPWFLAVKYPLNWAAWLYLAWAAVTVVISAVRAFRGEPARPGYTGAGLWLRVVRFMALTVFWVLVFFVATGVLSYGGVA